MMVRVSHFQSETSVHCLTTRIINLTQFRLFLGLRMTFMRGRRFLKLDNWLLYSTRYTSQVRPYLIFVTFLHRQNLKRIKLTPKFTQSIANLHSKLQIYTVNCQFFALNLSKFTPGKKKLHGRRPWRPWRIWGMLRLGPLILPYCQLITQISNPTSPLQYLLDVDFTLYECSVKHSIILIFQMSVRVDF